jgi:hypothetical protein
VQPTTKTHTSVCDWQRRSLVRTVLHLETHVCVYVLEPTTTTLFTIRYNNKSCTVSKRMMCDDDATTTTTSDVRDDDGAQSVQQPFLLDPAHTPSIILSSTNDHAVGEHPQPYGHSDGEACWHRHLGNTVFLSNSQPPEPPPYFVIFCFIFIINLICRGIHITCQQKQQENK